MNDMATAATMPDPLLFTDPVSLSYGDLDVTRGARSSAQLVRLVDAGGGGGIWTFDLTPQSASAGASPSAAFAFERACPTVAGAWAPTQ